jgi:amino acid adenylation domain-containing protein
MRKAIDRNLAAVLSERAGSAGHLVAIRDADRALTYLQLEGWANGIAAAITATQLDPSKPLAAIVHDQWALPATLWGAWKCGRMIVPLDTAQPQQRIVQIIADVGPSIVLSDETLPKAVAGGLAQINVLDVTRGTPFQPSHASPESPAVILYTSGSSGEPKGVLQTHRNILRSIAGYTQALALTSADRLPILVSMSGAQGLTTSLMALCTGACLCPWDVRRRGLAGIERWLTDEAATVLITSPSLFRRLLDVVLDDQAFRQVRAVKLGGEAVWREDVERFAKRFSSDCQLMQSLSSSETLSMSFGFVDGQSPPSGQRVSVGVDSPGVQILLVDEQLQPVATGSVGQIIVRSSYLSPGYWQQPQATADAFWTDADNPELRCYRTGDLGRRLDDGQLVHCGRKDDQVKVRGNRVEPAEIERRALALPAIANCAVLAGSTDSGDSHLDLFYQVEAAAALSPTELRQLLGTVLPQYMLPSRLVPVEQMPYAANGKVDRAALRTLAKAQCGPDDTAPQSALQARMARIWEEAFGFPVGLHADFFDLGGNSLTAMVLLAKLQQDFGISWPPSLVQLAPTIAGMARRTETVADEGPHHSLVPLSRHLSGVPLFCVHGVGGHTMRFTDLARALSDRIALFGVQPPGFGRLHSQRIGIPQLAELYVRDMLDTWTNGKCILAGYSLGGQVALEMASCLQRMGRKVDLVVLLDTLHPDVAQRRNRRHSLWTRTRNELRHGLARTWCRLLYYAYKNQRRALPGRLLHRLTSQVLWCASLRHQLPPYDGPIVLFQTAERRGLDNHHAWRHYPDLQLETLDGDHNTFLQHPHVASLATKLEALCAEVLGARPG